MNCNLISTGRRGAVALIVATSIFVLSGVCSRAFGEGREDNKEKDNTGSSVASATSLNSTNTAFKLTRSFDALEEYAIPQVVAEQKFYLDDFVMPATENDEQAKGKIEAVYEKVFRENRFVDVLEEASLIDLPIGIKVETGILTYAILIDSVIFAPSEEAYLFASMRFDVPQTGKKLYFKGDHIKFSRSGGLTGEGKLMLVGDEAMNLDGDKSQLIIKGENGRTFVEFDCRGYKQLSIEASLVFSSDLLLPEDNKGQVIENKNVSVDFLTTVVDWNDILLSVNVPRFQVKGLKDVSFEIKDAVLDFSDTRNPLSMTFPEGYAEESPLIIGSNYNLWRGVYIRELTVYLPPQFKTNEQGEREQIVGKDSISYRTNLKGNNLILDNVGFSGKISGNNLIPLEKGKIGNWDFSLDNIYVDVVANELVEGGFRGQVNIPINKAKQDANGKKKAFAYSAVIRKGNEYIFTVSNADTLNFDLWKAHATLTPASYIEVKLKDKEFLPKAHLNGLITMNVGLKNGDPSSDGDKNVRMPKLTFEALEIQTVKPYVQVGHFSLGIEGEKSKMGGFPIRINEISGGRSGDDIKLEVDLTLSLIKEGDGGFGAGGRFALFAESVEKGNDLTYKFKKIQIERFDIDIDKGAFKFKGTLNFYREDPVYGNGISGTVLVKFAPGIQLESSAIFGTKSGMRYWYVDGLVTIESGVAIFPGFAFYSFGGGAYYHMKIDDQGVGSPLGKTNSGVVYVPDESVSFGLKATIGVGLQPGKSAFNADATFEMAFNTRGGLKYINFRANGYFISTPEAIDVAKIQAATRKLASVCKKAGSGEVNTNEKVAEEIYGPVDSEGKRSSVRATLVINYDFDNSILHSNLKVYIDFVGVIKGGGPNGLAGEAVMHFEPGEWYIYIGRPEYENRFAIEVLGIARFDTYFVMGTVIPDSPPPPANVSSILGGVDLDYMKDLNALGDGAGIGFGASLSIDTGDLTFLMFYGRFAMGIGFDIMLKRYEAECEGRGELGINGWYANGQSYAYVEGNIGIKVRVFSKKKNIEILAFGAAVIMQAKLPNPTWIKGIAGGYFRVLGGLVKGNCKFEIEIGQECKLIQDHGELLQSLEVVSQVTPADATKEVDVFTVPQAVFNFEMEKEYEMVDASDNIVKFKVSLDEFAVKQNGAALTADLRWNDDKTVAALNPFEILPPQKELTMEVVVSFKEKKSGNWVVSTVDGEKLTQKFTYKFITGDAPDYIPAHNVAYSYPTVNQFNYYKNEYAGGYITLKQGQSYLFEKNGEWGQVVRFTPNSGSKTDVKFSYAAAEKEVRFTIPQNLTNEQFYELDIVNVPKGYLEKIDENVTIDSATVATGDPGVDLKVTTKAAEGVLKEGQEKKIYTSYFRTSRYNTFREKVVSVSPSSGWRDPIVTGVHAIGSNIGGPEPFSYEEIYGSDLNAPLVQMEADLKNVSWYNNEVYPLVYKDYPIEGKLEISDNNRDTELYGVVPAKAVFLYQYPYSFSFTDEEAKSGTVKRASTVGRFDYYLAYYMYFDYVDLAGQAANYVANRGSSTNRLDKLLTTSFPVIRKGDYWVNINYVLPGKNTVSSTYRHKIYNPID